MDLGNRGIRVAVGPETDFPRLFVEGRVRHFHVRLRINSVALEIVWYNDFMGKKFSANFAGRSTLYRLQMSFDVLSSFVNA